MTDDNQFLHHKLCKFFDEHAYGRHMGDQACLQAAFEWLKMLTNNISTCKWTQVASAGPLVTPRHDLNH